MTIVVTAESAAEAYAEMIPKIRVYGKREESRNGPVLAFQEPLVLTIKNPRARIVLDATRRANPVFHLMESVWMLAGRKDVEFPSRFVKQIAKYSDDGELKGAYGWRWRRNFLEDQLLSVIRILKDDPTSRQAVLTMWDPDWDLGVEVKSKDRPCNTHIYLRIKNGALEMTVCNRSNDIIWGMLGANIVHMTVLHEFLAWALDVPLGSYTVFTNNAHFYLNMPRAEEILNSHPSQHDGAVCDAMFKHDDDFPVSDFLKSCERFCDHRMPLLGSWLNDVCVPMYECHKGNEIPIGCLGWAEAYKVWRANK